MDRLRIKRSTDRYREDIQGVAKDAGLEQEEIEEIFREDQIIVAIRNGNFLGFVSFRYTDSTAKITALAVEKRFRREGVASRLLKEAEESAKNGECERMEAETSNDNIPALTFFQNHDFRIVDVETGGLVGHHGSEERGWGDIPVRDLIKLEKEI